MERGLGWGGDGGSRREGISWREMRSMSIDRTLSVASVQEISHLKGSSLFSVYIIVYLTGMEKTT